MKVFEAHPAAIYPELPEPALAQLALDVKRHGLVNPIVLYEDKVLDGRARQTACVRAGVKLRFTTYEGEDPVDFVASANGGRQLSLGERAITAAKLAVAWETIRVPPGTREVPGGTRDGSERAARATGLSRRTVFRAKRLLVEPGLVAAVLKGELRVAQALKRLPSEGAEPRQPQGPSSLRTMAVAVERMEKRLESLRIDLRELCADPRARKLLDDTLSDLSRELYAVADGSAYTEANAS